MRALKENMMALLRGTLGLDVCLGFMFAHVYRNDQNRSHKQTWQLLGNWAGGSAQV